MIYYGLPGPWTSEVEEKILSAAEAMARDRIDP
jgi:hypothetical protein